MRWPVGSGGWRVLLALALGVGMAGCNAGDPAREPTPTSTRDSGTDAPSPGYDLGECVTSIDCQPGFRCVDSRCLQICGQGDPCENGLPCTDGLCGLPGDCVGDACSDPSLCRPGSRWCGDTGPMVCASNGSPLPAHPCEPGFSCFEGECVPVACDDDQPAVCDGNHIIVCGASDDRVQAVIPCGQGEFQCQDGACVPRLCELGELQCANRIVRQCRPDGQSWRFVEECGPLEICEVDRCQAANSCTPGERRCDGETVVACNDSRVGYHEVEQCAGYCDHGRCEPAACQAAETWCEGNVAHACDARGTSLSSHHCGPDAVCDAGTCMPRLCQPDATRCDTGLRLRCNDNGTGWLHDSCEGGTACLAGACLPEGTQVADGLACDGDGDCLGGECLGGLAFPRGYCSTRGCSGDEDCVGGGTCFQDGALAYCASRCLSDADCRSGYGCFDDADRSVCRAVIDPGPFGADFPFYTDCDSQLLQADYFESGDGLRQFSVMTTSGQEGLYVGLYHLTERAVEPWNLIDSSGAVHPLGREHPIYAANTQLIDGVVGLLLPASPSHADFVDPGQSHRLTLASPDDLVCAYVIPTQPDGTQLDINLIGVGVEAVGEGLVEGSALAEMVAHVEEIFAMSGLGLGQTRLAVADDQVIEDFQILRSHGDLQALLRTGSAPGPTLDERLSIDVFIVRDIVFSGVSVVGASGGMPGLAGLHGFPSTGLATSAADLESDAQAVAQVMAHEIGHFLGLAHTTEVNGTTIEPIDDTPTCGYLITLAAEFCPDASNLMYPYAIGSARRLSAGQRWVLQMSPLTKP